MGPELIQFYNDAYRATMGPERHPSALGQRGRECWAEIWDIIGPQIDHVIAGKGSTWDEERLIPVTRNGRREDVWWTYGYSPIDVDGEVGGVLVVCNDVTSHVMAENDLRLINDELKHRVRNTLTVVSAMASQTLRGNVHNDALVRKFHDRLAAFARAHDSLTATTWATARMSDVVNGALLAHQGDEAKVSIEGPNVVLGSRQAVALALAIHELATNATKYGALSSPSGRVRVNWQEAMDDRLPALRFCWNESGGPAVARPTRTGFGSRLIERVLSDDLNAKVDLDYAASGLTCTFTALKRDLGPQAAEHPFPAVWQ